MGISAVEYGKQLLENQKQGVDKETSGVDRNTSLGMAHAIAEAGKKWGELPKEKRTADNAEALAIYSVAKEDLFLDVAGTKRIVERYTEELIARSYAKDEKEGKAKGTHLMAYLGDTSEAVKDVNFDEVKERVKAARDGNFAAMAAVQGDLKKFKEIKEKIGKSAKEHIGTEGAVENDFVKTLNDPSRQTLKVAAPAKAQESGKKQNAFDEVTADKPKKEASSPDWMQLIGMLLSALLGVDLSGFFGSQQQGQAQNTPAAAEGATPANAPANTEAYKKAGQNLDGFLASAPKNKDNQPPTELPQGVVPGSTPSVPKTIERTK